MGERVIHAALLGLGTVGTGVYKVLKNQEAEMTAKIGCKVKISRILVRNIEKSKGKGGGCFHTYQPLGGYPGGFFHRYCN